MATAQGLFKQTTIGKQAALGTPKVGAGGQILRRKTSVFTTTRDISNNDEIVSHRQDTGITYGQKKVSGKIDGNLSPATYKLFMAGIIRKAWTATAALTGLSLTIAGSGPYTITRGSGDFLAGGVKAGDIIRITAGTYTNAVNRDNNFLCTGVTATVLTGVMLNGEAMIAEGPIASSTVTVMGMKVLAPLTGHTNDYFTIEEWYADLSRSELFPDCKVNQMQVGIPASGACSASFDIVGTGTRTLAAAQSFTTPTVETTTGEVEGVRGLIYVNGAVVANATASSLTVDSGVSPIGAAIGSVVSADLNQSRLKVNGNFSAQFSAATLQSLFDNETPVSLILIAAVDNTRTADFVAFTMGRIKITGDAPNDGEIAIIRNYPFTAELNGAGGAALAWDQTIISIQDTQAS